MEIREGGQRNLKNQRPLFDAQKSGFFEYSSLTCAYLL